MSLSSAWISCRAPGSGGRGGSHAMLPQFDAEAGQSHVHHQQHQHQQHQQNYAHAQYHQHQLPPSRMHAFSGSGGSSGGGGGAGGARGSYSGSLPSAAVMAMMPAQLPARSSPLRALAICVVGVVCLVAILATLVAAIDPMAQRGSAIVAGMGDAVGSAIARANEAAERNAQAHYRARDEYLQRRGLRRIDDAFPTPAPAPAAAELEWPLLRGGEDDALSEALQRWEALREVDADDREVVNADVVRRNFPGWLAKRPRGAPWDEQLVLRDVVLVVSRLAAEHRRQQEGGGGQHEGSRAEPARALVRANAEAITKKPAGRTADAADAAGVPRTVG